MQGDWRYDLRPAHPTRVQPEQAQWRWVRHGLLLLLILVSGLAGN